MWFYFYPHLTYHLIRWIPKENHQKLKCLLFVFSSLLLAPEFIILRSSQSARACSQPLLNILITSTIFLFFSIAFGMIFWIVEPVSNQVKLAFHLFGVASFILGIFTIVYFFSAGDCVTSTTQLYYWCMGSSVLVIISTVYFLMVVPFWLLNRIFRNSLLNWKTRTGLCLEPVSNCSCIWHI